MARTKSRDFYLEGTAKQSLSFPVFTLPKCQHSEVSKRHRRLLRVWTKVLVQDLHAFPVQASCFGVMSSMCHSRRYIDHRASYVGTRHSQSLTHFESSQ
jgi:hypothetical protein